MTLLILYKKTGFKEPPFNQTPDTRFLFKSSQHMAALDHLKYALLMDGFTLLTGTSWYWENTPLQTDT